MLRLRRLRARYARRVAVTDVLVVVVSVALANVVRFDAAAALRVPLAPDDSIAVPYPLVSGVLIVSWLASLELVGSRDRRLIGTGTAEYGKVVRATMWTFGLVAILSLMLKVEPGRVYIAFALPTGLVGLLVGRWIWRRKLTRRDRPDRFSYRAVLVGDAAKCGHVAAQVVRDRSHAFELLGAIVPNDGGCPEELRGDLPVLGDMSDPVATADRCGADTIVFTGTDSYSPRDLRVLGWEIEARGMELVVAPVLTDVAGPRIHTSPVAGLPLISVSYPTLEGPRRIVKRIFDIAVSFSALTILSPVFLAIAVAIKLTDKGPVIFRQERIGLNETPFTIHKFRTMKVDAEAEVDQLIRESGGKALRFKLENDPRITRIGSLLRKYSLDELPQFWTVLLGRMSIVGPRPQVAREVAEYDEAHFRRLLVKPGITGLWQVNGRNLLSPEESLRLDLYYVENWNLVGDVVLLAKTIREVLRPTGAY